MNEPGAARPLPVPTITPLPAPAAGQGEKSRSRAELALLAVCVIWGTNYVVLKAALEHLHPLVFNALRLSLSAAFLGLLHLRVRRRTGFDRRTWSGIVALGLLSFGYQWTFISGIQLTSAGNAALILSAAPAFTAGIGFLMGERLGWRAWSGLALASAGAAVIALEGRADLTDGRVHGNLLLLVAAGGWGAYTAFTPRLARTVPATSLAFYVFALPMPLYWLIALPDFDAGLVGSLAPTTWAAIAFSGFFATGLAYALWNTSVRQVGASQTAAFVNLVPVLAVVMGALLLGESIRPLQIGGGAAVLLGVWATRRARQRMAVGPGAPRV